MIGQEQLTWLANDLEHASKDRLVVIATHIALVSFLDQDFVKHQRDDFARLYELLEGREALSVSGHTQSAGAGCARGRAAGPGPDGRGAGRGQ